MINRHVRAIIIYTTAIFSLGAASAKSSSISTPNPNWSGFYVGVNAGYAWGAANDSIQFQNEWITDGTGDNIFLKHYGTHQLFPNGFNGGAQIGYNRQIKNLVLSLAADFDYLGLDSSYTSGVVQNTGSGNTYTLTSSFSTNWLIMLRPRLGLALGSFLPYITSGLAINNQKFSQQIQQQNIAFTENASLSNTGYGWVIGAGTEYALLSNWRISLEYLYLDFPTSSSTSVGTQGGAATGYSATHSIKPNTNIIRAGLIYSFG